MSRKDGPSTVAWPDDGELGTCAFFHFHPAGNCRITWCGMGPDGSLRFDAPDLGYGFAIGSESWRPFSPNLADLALHRSGPLFVASCRAFAMALGPAIGAEADRCAGLGLPKPVLRACYGRLARLAERTMDETAAIGGLRAWMGSAAFLDDVHHFAGKEEGTGRYGG